LSTNLENTLRTFILQEFLPNEDPSNLKDDTPLLSGGVLDSISVVRLVSFLEEEFEIEIQAHESAAMESIQEMATLIRSKQD
jgi:acyl carrier protein